MSNLRLTFRKTRRFFIYSTLGLILLMAVVVTCLPITTGSSSASPDGKYKMHASTKHGRIFGNPSKINFWLEEDPTGLVVRRLTIDTSDNKEGNIRVRGNPNLFQWSEDGKYIDLHLTDQEPWVRVFVPQENIEE